MTGLEKRLNRLFGKAKKQPSAKAIHLLSFFITLLGVVLVLVLALTLLIPELVLPQPVCADRGQYSPLDCLSQRTGC